MPINGTYRSWIHEICERCPKQRKTQARNFVWLAVGPFHSHSVHLGRIAGKMMANARNESTVGRLSRFLANPSIDVRRRYKPIARQWLQRQWERAGGIRLIVVGTRIGSGHPLLMVSLAHQQRAVPIAGTRVKNVPGHSTGQQQVC